MTYPGLEALTLGVTSTVSEAGTEGQQVLVDLGQAVSAIRKGCAFSLLSPPEQPWSPLPGSLSPSSPPTSYLPPPTLSQLNLFLAVMES